MNTNPISTASKSQLLGNSKSIIDIRTMIEKLAPTDATVLIIGESGCGKEIVAKELHNLSSRNNSNYMKINCAAIPDNLLESELFGYEKGAFTGANLKNKQGMFELTSDGTLLLDEIGEMPLNLQSKLLRVLQEKEYMRLGGQQSIKVNTRIIAASNRDLLKMVAQGHFRMDLYYRLNVVPIYVPPLRERKEDISLLSNHFLEYFNSKYSKSKFFTDDGIILLENRQWLGNVRELMNSIERLVIICNADQLDAAILKTLITSPEEAFIPEVENSNSLEKMVSDFEKKIIENAIQTHKTTYKAAESLDINQSTLYRKAKKYHII